VLNVWDRAETSALSLFSYPLKRSVDDAGMRRNMEYALSLGLKPVHRCAPHDLVMVIAGGGPSLQDTYTKLRKPGPKTRVNAVNGSHDWLIDKGIVPYSCALMDPAPHLADRIAPHRDVMYFVSSTCDRSVFDRLSGYHVRLWHASGQVPDEQQILSRHFPDWLMIGGGSTVSLRSILLFYALGFRSFRLHGFDSCSRRGKRHAYAQDDGVTPGEILFRGYHTTPAWLVQVTDFFGMLDRMSKPDTDPITIKMYGDGLLQSEFKRFQKECGRHLFN
jgi:hypothetical protein